MAEKEKKKNPAEMAADAVGSVSELARALGVSRQAVYSWMADGCIPRDRLPDVARITGLGLADLAPDLFRR